MSENQVTQEQVEKPAERTFTQAEVDRIVESRLAADRRSRDLTPEQVAELKQRAEDAEKATTAAQEAQRAAERDALVARLQRSHGISDEDAQTFLTATDPDTLAKQAERLGSLTKPTERPDYGHPKVGGNTEPPTDPEREFLRSLIKTPR